MSAAAVVGAVIVIALLLVAVAYAMGAFSGGASNNSSTGTVTVVPNTPVLKVVQFPTYVVFANGTSSLTLSVTNTGSPASDVVVHLSSEAFENAQSPPGQVTSAGATQFIILVRANDKADAIYPVTITATYSDGSQSVSLGSGNVMIGPMVTLTNIGWPYDFPAISSKSTIGRNDSTDSYLTVHSFSKLAQYTNVNVTESFEGDHAGLTITPSSQPAGIIGPQSDSQRLTFRIVSNNAPTGTYPILIRAWESNVEVAEFTIYLGVSG